MECKTDWQRSDSLEAAEYNRIRANQQELGALAAELYDGVTMPPSADAAYTTSDTAAAVEALERGLDALLDVGVYNPGIAPRKTWRPDSTAPVAEDVNRWEASAAALYSALTSQAALRPVLAFTLGGECIGF